MEKKNKIITFYSYESDYKKFKELCEKNRTTISEVLRKCIAEKIKKQKVN